MACKPCTSGGWIRRQAAGTALTIVRELQRRLTTQDMMADSDDIPLSVPCRSSLITTVMVSV